MKPKISIALLFLTILSLGVRIVGVNWDQNQHLHPDERFLTMVTLGIKWPTSIINYLDTNNSSANPNNQGFDFYVYGTLPVYIVKAIAEVVGMSDYNNLTLVGRVLSALVDTGSMLLVIAIAKKLGRSTSIALGSGLVYALMALPIQLSHFYATDPYVTFFILLCVLFSLHDHLYAMALSGISFALALSAKVSAVIALPIIGICMLTQTSRNIPKLLRNGIVFILFALPTLRLGMPYVFTSGIIPTGLNPKYISNIAQLQSFNNPNGWFPPAVQWINISKGLFPLENMVLWGIGIPMALLAGVGAVWIILNIRKDPKITILLIAIAIIFSYQSTQFAQPLRYFYLVYPFLAITIAIGMNKISLLLPNLGKYGVIASICIWPIATLSLYTHPHTRVAATDWALQNIPAGSRISCEVWDDCVPLNGAPTYQFVSMPLYDSETPQKWELIKENLQQIDYLILSSNRLYGSISSAPEKYPQTSQWYQDLFSQRLGFKKVIEFTSRPHLPIPGISLCITPPEIKYGKISYTNTCDQAGISFVDDYADETWTVYDHPKVTIFKKETK